MEIIQAWLIILTLFTACCVLFLFIIASTIDKLFAAIRELKGDRNGED